MRLYAIAFATVALAAYSPVQAPQTALHRGAKVFIAPMSDGFDAYIKNALIAKQVPVQVVASHDEAELEIKGTSETQKASAAKKIFTGSWHSDEQASINVTDLKTGEIVYAYSANKRNSAHGKQTSAEACAKHLKEVIEKGK
jgi:hypothetical protein